MKLLEEKKLEVEQTVEREKETVQRGETRPIWLFQGLRGMSRGSQGRAAMWVLALGDLKKMLKQEKKFLRTNA